MALADASSTSGEIRLVCLILNLIILFYLFLIFPFVVLWLLRAAAAPSSWATSTRTCSSDEGLDEISPCGPTQAWVVKGGAVTRIVIKPEDFGLRPLAIDDIRGLAPSSGRDRRRYAPYDVSCSPPQDPLLHVCRVV
jgi:hypothetical protein